MIIDSPRFAWRGMHLDVSRQVYDTQDILDFLDISGLEPLQSPASAFDR